MYIVPTQLPPLLGSYSYYEHLLLLVFLIYAKKYVAYLKAQADQHNHLCRHYPTSSVGFLGICLIVSRKIKPTPRNQGSSNKIPVIRTYR